MADPMYQTPLQSLGDFVKIIVVALIIAFFIRTFAFQPYIIPSGSMLETLHIGDRLFVTKFSYGIHLPFIEKEVVSLGEPELGDIIVFPFPKDPKVDFIKRVVGLPGDVVELRDKKLYRNGEFIEESYVEHKDPYMSARRDSMSARTVPPGKVFVLGDNRDHSEDSRFWGFVDKDTIHGKALVVYWSSQGLANIDWSRIGTWLR